MRPRNVAVGARGSERFFGAALGTAGHKERAGGVITAAGLSTRTSSLHLNGCYHESLRTARAEWGTALERAFVGCAEEIAHRPAVGGIYAG
jgi:hypothetical protein